MSKKKDWNPGRQDDSAESRKRLLMAIGAVAGAAAAGIWATQRFSRSEQAGRLRARVSRDIHVRKTYTINRQPDAVYGFWRKLENLPQFMKHLESVELIGERRSRWRAKGPAGFKVEWEAELIDDRPNERIAWRSLEGSTVPNRGSVRFDPAPGSRGTSCVSSCSMRCPAVARHSSWASCSARSLSSRSTRISGASSRFWRPARSRSLRRIVVAKRRSPPSPCSTTLQEREGKHEGELLDGHKEARSSHRSRSSDPEPA